MLATAPQILSPELYSHLLVFIVLSFVVISSYDLDLATNFPAGRKRECTFA